jgi:hypothetical protein
MKYCKICGEAIPEGRIKALPNTETCVEHSDVNKKLGFAVITGKDTYTELDIVEPDTYEELKKLERKNFGSGLHI